MRCYTYNSTHAQTHMQDISPQSNRMLLENSQSVKFFNSNAWFARVIPFCNYVKCVVVAAAHFHVAFSDSKDATEMLVAAGSLASLVMDDTYVVI